MIASPPPPIPNLLVVDDATANLELLTSLFGNLGFRVRPVPSGELALQAAAREVPDLVLLDISMPGLNGYEVCQRLKADPRLAAVPVIFLSALDDPLDKVRAFAVGGVDYVTKPFHFGEVEARVRTHLTLRRQERELELQIARLRELEHLRDNLVHMIVHDLRSPLTSVVMTLDLLQDGPAADPQFQREQLRAASEAASRVNRMVTQLLDVSRLEAGEMPVLRQPGNLTTTLRRAADLIAPSSPSVPIRVDSAAPCPASFDPDLIERVVVNLLANALRYSPAGAEVQLGASSENHHVRVDVRDAGPGIAPADQDRIFEKFGQVRSTDRLRGSGLGLTFCRLAVEAHGGRIGVHSQPGHGSTFWFTLPLDPPPDRKFGS